MVEVKLLGRVKYKDTLYVADDVAVIDESTAEYLQEKNLCKVLGVFAEAKVEANNVANDVAKDKPTKKSKKVKQESK